MAASADSRHAQLIAIIRDVPDFPKPGILFKDITPLLADGAAFAATVAMLAERTQAVRADVVVAIESRGFLFGAPVAAQLGLGIVPVRKRGKLPFRTQRVEYALEYGTDILEIHEDALKPGARVVIIDDLLATGGTAAATALLCSQLGAEVVACCFVIELAFLAGRQRLGAAAGRAVDRVLMARSPRRGALIIDADPVAAGNAAEALAAVGYDTTCVSDAEMGLRALGAHEPEILLLDLELRGRDGRWLLRRLRDDFMGVRPRVILHTRSAAIAGGIADLGVDSVVLKPAHPRAVVMAAAMPQPDADPGRPERLRELVKLSLLDGDLGYALNALAHRLAIGFRTAECVVVGQLGDRQVTGAARGPQNGEWPAAFGEHCRAALDAGAPVLGSTDDGVQTLLGIPFAPPGSMQLGYVILLDDAARAFSLDSVDDLRTLAQRLHRELAWRSVHERIAADRDRLRESSMLDPMLSGVWTRAALEQALPGEVSAATANVGVSR